MADGASTSTTRRAPRSPRPGSHPARRAALRRAPSGLGQAFNFDLLEADFDAGAVPHRRRRTTSSSRHASGSSTHLGALQPRRRAARRPATGCRARARARRPPANRHGSEWLLRRREPAPRLARRASPGAGRDPVAARRCPARPTSTRARSSACRRSPTSPTTVRQDPPFFRSRGFDVGPRRLPGAAAVDGTGPSFGFGAGGRRTCRSRRGWRGTRSPCRTADPGSTLHLYRQALRCAASCSRERTSSGVRRASRTSCGSPATRGGRS